MVGSRNALGTWRDGVSTFSRERSNHALDRPGGTGVDPATVLGAVVAAGVAAVAGVGCLGFFARRVPVLPPASRGAVLRCAGIRPGRRRLARRPERREDAGERLTRVAVRRDRQGEGTPSGVGEPRRDYRRPG